MTPLAMAAFSAMRMQTSPRHIGGGSFAFMLKTNRMSHADKQRQQSTSVRDYVASLSLRSLLAGELLHSKQLHVYP